VLAVRWYLRFGLSYRDVEELLAERGVEVDHVTIYRVGPAVHPPTRRRCPALPARRRRPLAGGRDLHEGRRPWHYVYRAIDQSGQVIDVFVSARRDATAARWFFQRAIGATKVTPVVVTTDQAPVYPAVLEGLLPAAWHRTER
jgi:IS6 family transposase